MRLDERVREPDLLDDALDVVDRDRVAEAQRLGEGDHDAGDEVRERALGGEADDEADDGGRGEEACGDRAHLRDDEERGEDSDEDDRRHQAAAQDPVARRGGRGQLAPGHAPVDELREDDRADDDHASRAASVPRSPWALYSTGRRAILSGRSRVRELAQNRHSGAADSAIGSQRVAGGTSLPTRVGVVGVCYGRLERLAAREALVEAVPEADLVLAQAPAEQHILARRAVAGKSTRPSSRSFTSAPTSWIRATQRAMPATSSSSRSCTSSSSRGSTFAAVARDPRRHRRLPLLELDERAPVLDQLLGERTHLQERLVRLLCREVPLLHARMIRPS